MDTRHDFTFKPQMGKTEMGTEMGKTKRGKYQVANGTDGCNGKFRFPELNKNS